MFESAEQGYFHALRKTFSFWHLFHYALECPTQDDFMSIMDDELDYSLEEVYIDSSVLWLALEYFYKMLFDRYIGPATDYIKLDLNHTHRFKILGKEGLVVWLNVN